MQFCANDYGISARSGFNGLPTPNTPLMKDSDWIINVTDASGYRVLVNYGRIGNHLILGANLIDK